MTCNKIQGNFCLQERLYATLRAAVPTLSERSAEQHDVILMIITLSDELHCYYNISGFGGMICIQLIQTVDRISSFFP